MFDLSPFYSHNIINKHRNIQVQNGEREGKAICRQNAEKEQQKNKKPCKTWKYYVQC